MQHPSFPPCSLRYVKNRVAGTRPGLGAGTDSFRLIEYHSVKRYGKENIEPLYFTKETSVPNRRPRILGRLPQ